MHDHGVCDTATFATVRDNELTMLTLLQYQVIFCHNKFVAMSQCRNVASDWLVAKSNQD